MLQLLLLLAVLIAAAKMLGLASTRVGQPAVLGELLAGLLLGPSVLNVLALPFFSDKHLGETVSHLAEIGVILLMFIAGLEVDLGQMRRAGRVVVFSGLSGVFVPLLMGAAVALPFGYTPTQAVGVGMLLAATSVSISAQTLLELGVLRSKEGIALLGAAVVDDVVVILLLSIMLALTGGTGAGLVGILWLIGRMILYLALFGVLGRFLIPWLLTRVNRWPISQGLLAAIVVIVFIFAWAAEVLGGIAMITGAFLAGIFAARTGFHRPILEGVSALTYGFFVPIFFANIGLHADLGALRGNLVWLALLIVIVAIASKIVGCSLGAWAGGFGRAEALRLGVGMISRGEVGLIVATLVVNNGLAPPDVITVAVLMVIVTTLATPPLLRIAFRGRGEGMATAAVGD
jgi:Kef-type K+ transport system membrane component KefB